MEEAHLREQRRAGGWQFRSHVPSSPATSRAADQGCFPLAAVSAFIGAQFNSNSTCRRHIAKPVGTSVGRMDKNV